MGGEDRRDAPEADRGTERFEESDTSGLETAGPPRRRGRRATACLLVLLLGAYAVADARDAVPGVLTVRPAPEEPRDLPDPDLTAVGADEPVPLDADALRPHPDRVADLARALAGDERVRAGTPGLPAPGSPPPAQDAEVAPGLAAQQSVPPGTPPSVLVLDTLSGDVLATVEASRPRVPASTTKLLTAAAALTTLPAGTTLPTVVRLDGDTLTLVAGGDILLAPDAGDPTSVEGRAGVGDLARATAAALRERGVERVTVRLDDRTLPPEGLAPGLEPEATRWVMPGGGLAVAEGGADGGRAPDPALDAADRFAAALVREGLALGGATARAEGEPAPEPAGEEIARVESAPVGDLVQYALKTSDNSLTEMLGRQVALVRGASTDRATVVREVLAAVRELGVDTTGAELSDVSGLSPHDRLSATTLAQVARLGALETAPEGEAAAPSAEELDRLSGLPVGLPVGALDGTLDDRMAGAAGVARAKTGTLGAVASLAGQVRDVDGRLLTFVVIADGLPQGGLAPARAATDEFVAALAACGCR